MAQALTVVEAQQQQMARVTVPTCLEEFVEYGKLLAASGMFPDSKSAATAAVKVLAGAELGFPPFASMNGIHIIQGKAVLSASLMAAAIKRSGRYTFRVTTHDDKSCVIEFLERFGDKWERCGVSSFTAADAIKAGLTNDMWKKYPRNMMYSRALANGARWYCPDVFAGPVYAADELGAEVDEGGHVINASFSEPLPPVAEAPAYEAPPPVTSPAPPVPRPAAAQAQAAPRAAGAPYQCPACHAPEGKPHVKSCQQQGTVTAPAAEPAAPAAALSKEQIAELKRACGTRCHELGYAGDLQALAAQMAGVEPKAVRTGDLQAMLARPDEDWVAAITTLTGTKPITSAFARFEMESRIAAAGYKFNPDTVAERLIGQAPGKIASLWKQVLDTTETELRATLGLMMDEVTGAATAPVPAAEAGDVAGADDEQYDPFAGE